MNRIIKSNIRKYYLQTCLYNAVLIMISGGIVQAFMLESGISEDKVSAFIGLMQAVQAISMISMSQFLERTNVLKANGLITFGLYPLLTAMFVFCFVRGISPDIRFIVLVLTGAVTFFCIANRGVLEYKVPYDIFDMKEYGKVCSVNGSMVGIGNMAITAVLSVFLKRNEYFSVMRVFLLIAFFLVFLCAFVALSYRKVDVNFQGELALSRDNADAKKINLFKYRPFYLLALPNFLRGFAYGTTTLLTTVGYHYGIIDSVSASYMVLVSNLFIIFGCILYSKLTVLKKDGPITLITAACLVVTLPLMLVGKNTWFFLLMYGISLFIRTVMDYSIPVSIVYFVDYEVMGQYSSWRMALFMAGTAVSGFVTMPMVNRFGGEITLIINGVLFLAVGLAYFLVCRMHDRGKL